MSSTPTVINLLITTHGKMLHVETYHSRRNVTNPSIIATKKTHNKY